MRLRKLVVVGLVGIVCLAANAALAQNAPAQPAAASGVSFTDSNPELNFDRFSVHVRDADEARFTNLGPAPTRNEQRRDANYEVAFVASAAGGIDVSVSQRAGVGFDASGDLARESRSSELRLGRGLRGLKDDAPSQGGAWYFFAASEDEALIWRPGQRNAFGATSSGFALQDRVEIGDIQAGITYEWHGIQASLAYVEREINVRAGHQNFSQDERFAGFTLTMRR